MSKIYTSIELELTHIHTQRFIEIALYCTELHGVLYSGE